MRRILCLLAVLLFASPTLADPVASPPPTIAGFALPMDISAGHGLALGMGLFAGAVLGSVMIAGGGVAAAIGGIAGMAAGHWFYARNNDRTG
jgi:hypothetical protein